MKVFDSPADPALSAAKASSLSAAEAEGDILDPKTVLNSMLANLEKNHDVQNQNTQSKISI